MLVELISLFKEAKINTFKLINILIFILLFIAPKAMATDVVKLLNPLTAKDKRSKHKNEIIIRALQITEAEFGAYQFNTIFRHMTPKRATTSLKEGDMINTYIGPDSQLWENMGIAIKIPVRQGLLNYRLLLVHKSNLSQFSQIKSREDLSKLNAGLQYDWVTTTVFKNQGMKLTTAHNFEGLFQMLERARFDYIPRAIYEIYDELELRSAHLNGIVVEPTLALYIPMPTYVYVSPKEPRIAQRIETGLRKLIDSGEITDILIKYYADDIKRANLKDRTIINMSDSPINRDNLLNNNDFWLQN